MVKQNFLTKMLLLCALIVGSVSAWAQTTVTLWSEDFSSYSADDVPSGGTYSYVCENGGGTTKIWNENTAGGTAPELLVAKGSGSFSATISDLKGCTGTLTLQFLANQTNLTPSAKVGNTTCEISGTTVKGTTSTYTITLPDNASSVTIVFTQTSSNKNSRLDNIVLTGTKASNPDDQSVATTTTIDASGITNTDVYTSTTAGSLSATVSAGGNSISGATVSWSSSNTDVATIASDGAVTLVAAGTTTITASYAGVANQYKPSSATYKMTVTNSDPNVPGTLNNPYTVAQAIDATPSSGTSENVYIKGIVSKFYTTSIVGDGSNYRYYISDDGTETNQLLVYKGKGLNEATFSDADDLHLGDVVVIYGGLTTYNDTKEVAANNYIVSLIRPEKPKHNVTFSINGIAGEPVEVEQGDAIEFPADPDAIEGKTFVGWTAEAIDGTTDTAPTFVTSATMGTTDVIYYAVFATGSVSTLPANITITASTQGVPTSYGTANTFNEYELEGINFMIMQMYKSGGKLQWRAAGNSSGTGTMYNKDALNQIQSIVLTYNTSDSNKNFTVKVGDSENPEDGTSVTPAENESVYTFDCSSSNASYFVLTNGANAGYLDKIEINYLKESEDFSGYCTTVIPTGVTVTIASSGYTTLSSAYALDFSSAIEGLEAAYVVSALTGTKASFTKISKAVPAETGLVLKGTADAKVTIPFAASADELTETNYLKPCVNGGTVEARTTYAMSGGKFKLYTGTELPVGKAYLLKSDVDAAASNGQGAPELSFDFGEGTTGIQNIERTMNDNQYYTLDGRRVAQPTKGLYIVNGKKVLVP